MRGDIKREREKDVRHSVGLESEYQHYVYSFDPHGAQPLFNVMFIFKAHVTTSLSHVTHQRHFVDRSPSPSGATKSCSVTPYRSSFSATQSFSAAEEKMANATPGSYSKVIHCCFDEPPRRDWRLTFSPGVLNDCVKHE